MSVDCYVVESRLVDTPKKVSMIKEIRRITGLGLKESKDCVDNGTMFTIPDDESAEFFVDTANSYGYGVYFSDEETTLTDKQMVETLFGMFDDVIVGETKPCLDDDDGDEWVKVYCSTANMLFRFDKNGKFIHFV